MAKRGRKPKYDLSAEACPNAQCALFGKTGAGNIVSNGTHPAKDGRRLRKFLCRSCGGSFCERTGSIFYDLRSSEKQVMLALKLLVKGMPLRGVADVLEVKLDTVRRWLAVAAEHSEQLNERLLRELKVSQVELDALWSFVKKRSCAGERTFGRRSLDRPRIGNGDAADDFVQDRRLRVGLG
jgi:transposase-like protein